MDFEKVRPWLSWVGGMAGAVVATAATAGLALPPVAMVILATLATGGAMVGNAVMFKSKAPEGIRLPLDPTQIPKKNEP